MAVCGSEACRSTCSSDDAFSPVSQAHARTQHPLICIDSDTASRWVGRTLTIKRQFGFIKVHYKGLKKTTAQPLTLLTLSNLWMVRGQLMTTKGATG